MNYNVDIEKQVLSEIFINYDIIQELVPDYFFDTMNKTIFLELQKTNNVEIIIDNLKNDYPNIEKTIENIVLSKTRLYGINNCIGYMKKQKKIRDSIEFANEILETAHQNKLYEVDKIHDFMTKTDETTDEDGYTLEDSIKEYKKNYNIKPHFIKTGLIDLDKIFYFQKGDLITVAARPSLGKTAFQLQIGLGYAKHFNKTRVFSLEMKNEQLIQRIISNMAKVSLKRVRTKTLDEKEKKSVFEDLENKIRNLDFKIYDKQFSLKDIAKILRKEKDIDVIMIDYLQLMDTEAKNNRNQEIGAITRELKKMAKSYDIGIVLLSQLSRQVENRADKRPMMSDLRDSGEIEQDIDSCLMLYREEYYDVATEAKNILEVLVRKQRQGGLGTVNLFYDYERQIISSLL